jgi:hypothetical protein
MNWNDETPAVAGVYAVSGSKHDLRRAWSPKTGWSAPWYKDDPDDIVARAMLTDADRENVGHIRWAECTAP